MQAAPGLSPAVWVKETDPKIAVQDVQLHYSALNTEKYGGNLRYAPVLWAVFTQQGIQKLEKVWDGKDSVARNEILGLDVYMYVVLDRRDFPKLWKYANMASVCTTVAPVAPPPQNVASSSSLIPTPPDVASSSSDIIPSKSDARLEEQRAQKYKTILECNGVQLASTSRPRTTVNISGCQLYQMPNDLTEVHGIVCHAIASRNVLKDEKFTVLDIETTASKEPSKDHVLLFHCTSWQTGLQILQHGFRQMKNADGIFDAVFMAHKPYMAMQYAREPARISGSAALLVCSVHRRVIQENPMCSRDGAQLMFRDSALIAKICIRYVYRLGMHFETREQPLPKHQKGETDMRKNTRSGSGLVRVKAPDQTEAYVFETRCEIADLYEFVHNTLQNHASLRGEGLLGLVLRMWRIFPLNGCPQNGILLFHGTDHTKNVTLDENGGLLAANSYVSTNFANSARYTRVDLSRPGYLYVYGLELSKFTEEFFTKTYTGEYRTNKKATDIPLVPLITLQVVQTTPTH
jgi:hypothetical protein